MQLESFRPRRRTVIVGAGLGAAAAALAACSSPEEKPAAASSDTAADQSGSPAAPSTPTVLTTTADVPVGSGVIVDDTVITQPTAGVFKGFSAKCTHAGCNVSEIANGTIDCKCHGSKFNLDGSVANGPATKPLVSTSITVQGDSIVAG